MLCVIVMSKQASMNAICIMIKVMSHPSATRDLYKDSHAGTEINDVPKTWHDAPLGSLQSFLDLHCAQKLQSLCRR